MNFIDIWMLALSYGGSLLAVISAIMIFADGVRYVDGVSRMPRWIVLFLAGTFFNGGDGRVVSVCLTIICVAIIFKKKSDTP